MTDSERHCYKKLGKMCTKVWRNGSFLPDFLVLYYHTLMFVEHKKRSKVKITNPVIYLNEIQKNLYNDFTYVICYIDKGRRMKAFYEGSEPTIQRFMHEFNKKGL